MVAKFKTLYFNAELNDGMVTLWTYKKPSWLKDFKVSYDNECLMCYCRCVRVSEVSKLMLVGFSVVWNKIEFSCEYLPSKNEVKLFTENEQIAHDYEFKQASGSNLWYRTVPLEDVDERKVSEYDVLTKSTQIVSTDEEEFIGLWRLYVSNLSYGKRKDRELVKAFV